MTTRRFFVALRVVTSETSVDETASLVDFHTSSVATHDVVYTGVNIWPAKNHLTHLFSVSSGDTNGDRQFLCDLDGDTHFVHAEVRVR